MNERQHTLPTLGHIRHTFSPSVTDSRVRPLLVNDAFRASECGDHFHRWRCHTAAFLGPLAAEEEVEAQADTLVRENEVMLKKVLVNWDRDLRPRLRKIMLRAIELDGALAQQRAFWYSAYPARSSTAVTSGRPRSSFRHSSNHRASTGGNSEIRFNPDIMSPTNVEDPGPRVTLVISPGLFKAGDSHGEHYDSARIMTKCLVVCEHVPQTSWQQQPRTARGVVSVSGLDDAALVGSTNSHKKLRRERTDTDFGTSPTTANPARRWEFLGRRREEY